MREQTFPGCVVLCGKPQLQPFLFLLACSLPHDGVDAAQHALTGLQLHAIALLTALGNVCCICPLK